MLRLSSSHLDRKRQVAVIGAGIVGAACAVHLSKAGHKVTIVDRGDGPAAETSFGNAGLIAACATVPTQLNVHSKNGKKATAAMLLRNTGPLFWKPLDVVKSRGIVPWLLAYMKHASSMEKIQEISKLQASLIADSVQRHRKMCPAEIWEKFICEAPFTCLYKDKTEMQEDQDLFWKMTRHSKPNFFSVDEMTSSDLRARINASAASYSCALNVTPNAFCRSPGDYCAALSDHAVELGASRLFGRKVVRLERSRGKWRGLSDGAIRALVVVDESHSHTDVVECDSVVVAAGMWSGEVLETLLGEETVMAPRYAKMCAAIPLMSERGYHVQLEDVRGGPPGDAVVELVSSRFIATPQLSSSSPTSRRQLRLAGLVELASVETPPSEAPFEFLIREAKKAWPDLTWKGESRWMGHRPSFPDSLPCIDLLDDEVALAFGTGHLGLTGSAHIGELVTSLLSGTQPDIEVKPFSVARFLSNL